MANEKGTGNRSPSMLDLIRLSPLRLFPPGGEALYRQVARLTELSSEMELLDVASGKGIPLEFFAKEHGVLGTGVEEDPLLIKESDAHARAQGFGGQISFQEASPDDLPFRDETFDVVVGELGLAARVDPREAIRELARVTRPGGQVVLVQLFWKAPMDENRRRVLSEHLGAKPLMMVEVRQVLNEAGVRDLVTEDWTDEETAFRGPVKKPFPDFSELFTFREKLGILRRAWRRWGWRGVLTVFRREAEVHRLLTKERILGLSLLKGTKEPMSGGSGEDQGEEEKADQAGKSHHSLTGPDSELSGDLIGETPREPSREPGDLQTTGLPLFGPDSSE